MVDTMSDMGGLPAFARGSEAPQGRLSRLLLGEGWGVRSVDGRTEVDSDDNRRNLVRFAILPAGLYAGLGFVILLLIGATGTELEGLRLELALAGTSTVAFVAAPLGALIVRRASLPWFHLIGLMAVTGVIGVGFALGPSLRSATVTAWVLVMISISVGMAPRATIAYTMVIGVQSGVLYAVQAGNENPVALWLSTMGGLLIVSRAVAWLVDRIRVLAVAEWRAHAELEAAHAATAELNRTLEERVAGQVAELTRLGRLQRFLAAPIVDAVLSDGVEVLEPHGREIAVMFCDLRGFTAWAAASSPDEVHDLMQGYFELLGTHARRHEATVGAFTGDGMMAFWNDPVPCPDPVDRAVAMALQLQEPMADLLAPHRAAGHDLGFGVGITYGYANIGMIGFEGRRDYTALGSVVNLADRLCEKAGPGEVLLDRRACVALTRGRCVGEPLMLTLKGLDREVAAYRLGAQAIPA